MAFAEPLTDGLPHLAGRDVGASDPAASDVGGSDAGSAIIVVPDPCLVVLVGATGAGKSTFARRWFAADEVLSSDDLRALVAGDPADQGASSAAFGILYRRLRARLRSGRTAVVDATNVRHAARRPLLQRARVAGVPAVAIVLGLPRDEVAMRNARRAGRVVPREVMERQLEDLQRTLTLDQLATEGFSTVHLVTSAAALAAVSVERVRAPEFALRGSIL